VIRRFDIRELDQLALDLTRPGAAAELGVLTLCLVAAWVVVRLVRGRAAPAGSVWFGNRIVDGVLFPVLALAFAYVARVALETTIKPAVFRVAIPILVSLVVMRLAVRVLTRTFPDVAWMRTIERSISWLAWIAVVLWVTGLAPMALDAMNEVQWKVGVAEVTLRNVVEGTITAGIVLVLALWVSGGIERALLKNAVGQDLSLRKIAATLARAALLFAGLMFALSAVGIDLTALSVLGGAIGVGVGFGLQNIINNFVSGLILQFERPIHINDVLEIDGTTGTVTRIGVRSSTIQTGQGAEVIIPNASLISGKVINWTLTQSQRRLELPVGVAYGTDPNTVIQLLQEAATKHEYVLTKPEPAAFFKGFGESALDFELQFWVMQEYNTVKIKSEVALEAMRLLDVAGIEIPFPQRDLHVRSIDPGATGLLPASEPQKLP